MGNASKIIAAVVVVAVLAGGAVLLKGGKGKDSGSTSTGSSSNSSTLSDQSQPSSDQSQNANSTDNTNETVAATITYDGNSFQPETTTVKAGSTVKITNQSSDSLEFDSDPHPVHTDNPELNVGDVPAGESRTFAVTTQGDWGFHNHLDSRQHGRITVE